MKPRIPLSRFLPTLRQISALCRLSLVFLPIAFAGCAMMENQGEKPISAEIPAAAPRTLGVESLSSAEHKKMIAQFGGEYNFPSAENFLNDMLAKLAKTGDEPSDPYTVTILNSPIINAFALPPDKIYVTRGLLALANDASEVAAVMAHEIGHITAHHAMLRAEEEKRAAVISQAASVIQSREKGEQVAAVEQRTIASFSRQQELDADQIGIRSIAAAGYDPYAASRFLNTMERARQLHAAEFGQTASQPDLLSTHPSTPERVQRAIAVAKEIGPPGTGITDRMAYLAAHRRHDVWRRSGRWRGPRPHLHSSAPRLPFRRAARFRPGEFRAGGARREIGRP